MAFTVRGDNSVSEQTIVPAAAGSRALQMRTGIRLFHCRLNCFWMEHLCSEVGELGSFRIGEAGDGSGLAYQARIGCKYTRDVGPYLHFVSRQRSAQERGCVVGTTATERGGGAINRGTDEAAEHRNLFSSDERLELGSRS